MPEINCYCFEIAESVEEMKENCIKRTLKSLSLDDKSLLIYHIS